MNLRLRDSTGAREQEQSCVSPASYWLPDLMTSSAWTEHAPFGFWIVEALRPTTIVELGVHRGFSYYVLCQAVQQLRLDARCFAIDTWIGDEHAGFYGEDVFAEICRHNRRYDGYSRLIRSDFSDACGQFADGSIDLLHIDGCHTYEAARRDFETWLPKLSPRGVVLFHDTAEYENGFGVYRLWEALRGRYPHFEFTHGHGLGIIGVGENLHAKAGRLFEASANRTWAGDIRASYERLGALTQRVQQLETAISAYEASTSWRITAPLRMIARLMRSVCPAAGKLGATLRDADAAGEVAKSAYLFRPSMPVRLS
jgi:O-antigen biosynthesis protein